MSAGDETKSDPASSLRAAALLTLKSKRRKPDTASSRPPQTSDLQIDYGNDEPQREEGEISDSEDAKNSPKKQRSASIVPKVESPTRSLFESTPVPYSDRPVYVIDPNHVRPGLEMTQAQYDTAKDIILDLLGWSVPPEYLLDCGISREMIYYVFSELNLRLPANFDATGLVPYLPNDTPTDSKLPSDANSSQVHASPSDVPATDNLHDMERQRRQELLARKAVQASRKLKTTPSSDPSQDVEMSAVPTETVEDFLNSIEPTPDGLQTEYAMNVDEVPGLQGSRYAADPGVPPFSASPPSSSFSHAEPPPTSAETVEDDHLSQAQSLHRRGSKRPVAADFVDSDAVRNGLSQQRLVRRKMGGSFASVSTMRRCVIDLSDSEGDGEDIIMHEMRNDPERYGSGYSSPIPTVTSALDVPAAPTPPLLQRTNSPAMLLEKEKEIMKMRQLIAQREQSSRAKKLNKLNTSATAPDNSELLEDGAPREISEQANPPSTTSGSRSASVSTTPSLDPEHISNGNAYSEQIQPRSQASANGNEQSISPIEASESQQETQTSMVDVDPAMSSSTQVTTSASLSRQEENPAQHPTSISANPENYSAYSSPFDNYPLLRSRSRPLSFTGEESKSAILALPLALSLSNSSITSISSNSTLPSSVSLSMRSRSSSSSSVQSHFSEAYSSLPDLLPLKLANTSKVLDPSKRICQYEVPGGGVCRDESCEDIHLSRIGGRPHGGSQVVHLEPSDEDTAIYLSTALPANWLSGFGNTNTLILKIIEALHQARLDNPSMVFEGRVARALSALEPSLSTLT